MNNPTYYIDPSGHDPIDWITGLLDRLSNRYPSRFVRSAEPKRPKELSPGQQRASDMLNVTATTADITALGLSSSGAMLEVSLAVLDVEIPVGDAAGLGLYYEVINPVENAASLVALVSTIASDVIRGNNYIEIHQGGVTEIGIGQDTLVSAVGVLLGNGLPLEGVLDTLVNVPVVWYDVNSAAGNVPTLIEPRWDAENGYYFVTYPAQDMVDHD